MPSVIPQVGYGEVGAYAALPLHVESTEVVSGGSSAQVKHNKIKYERGDTTVKQSC